MGVACRVAKSCCWLAPGANATGCTQARGPCPLPCRTALDVCLLCNGAFMAIGFYLVVWLDYIKQNKFKWEVVAPRMVPTATAFGVAGVISCVGAGLQHLHGLARGHSTAHPPAVCVHAGSSLPFGRCGACSRSRSLLCS